MVIGLTVGVLGIQGTLKTSATLAITAPAVVMTLPMFDIVAALVRRRLTGRRFDAPDRLHIHHRLLDRGWTPWQVLCLIGALCLTMGAAATAATIFRRDALAWIAAMTLVVLMIRLRLFGHDEFALAKEAAIRALKSYAGFFARFAARTGFRVQDSGFGVRNSASRVRPNRTPEPRILNPEPRALNPELWDRLLRSPPGVEYPPSGVRLVARRSAPPDPLDRPGRAGRRAAAAGRSRCRCRPTTASFANFAPPLPSGSPGNKTLHALTSLLKTFGAHFAAHDRAVLRPVASSNEPTIAGNASRPPTQGGIVGDNWNCKAVVTMLPPTPDLRSLTPHAFPDLDIGVIYTHERELMPRLLATMSASGEGLRMRLILVDNASPRRRRDASLVRVLPRNAGPAQRPPPRLRGQLEPHSRRLGRPLRAADEHRHVFRPAGAMPGADGGVHGRPAALRGGRLPAVSRRRHGRPRRAAVPDAAADPGAALRAGPPAAPHGRSPFLRRTRGRRDLAVRLALGLLPDGPPRGDRSR